MRLHDGRGAVVTDWLICSCDLYVFRIINRTLFNAYKIGRIEANTFLPYNIFSTGLIILPTTDNSFLRLSGCF